jgi:esterase/lipase superfamily enzyme
LSDLANTIRALPAQDAIALLRRILRAVQPVVTRPSPAVQESQTSHIARSLSLTQDDAQPLSEGDIARTALLLLASDPRYANAVEDLVLRQEEMPAFQQDGQGLLAADLLAVLDMQLNPSGGGFESVGMPSDAGGDPGLLQSLGRQLIAFTGLRPAGPQADAEYRVWYATSRKPLDAADPSAGFGVERDDRIHYGSCRVFIPRSHKVGSLGSPWWKRLVTMTDDRVRLLSVDALAEEAYWQQMHAHLQTCALDDQDAVVFIHGFNVEFEQAALRAAQIGFDLQVKGVMAFYSWASRGEKARYPADEASIELDEQPIADFLTDLVRRSGARRVHLIVHSMGNRAALRAVQQIAQRADVRFGQVILAAADVDARKFRELCPAYTQVAERTTLYVSTRDLAVEASRWLHDFPRAGLMPPVTVAAGIDTVNAVNTDVTLLGHGYVAEARQVIGDIHALLQSGSPPGRRFGLRAVSTDNGEPYWLIGA